MAGFPNLSIPYQELITKLNNLTNLESTGKYPWIRIISAVGRGLVLQSIYQQDGFDIRYGGGSGGQSSGIVGLDLQGEPIRLDEGRKLRPSPIINTISIDEADIGRKKTTFTITCFSLEHANYVADHFLEPGFSVLVEWGWNTQLARKQWVGYEKQGNQNVTAEQILNYDNYITIKDKRKNSNFDYDATLGFITDGRISYGDGETYNIEVTLTSLGEVAEYMQQHLEVKEPGDTSQLGGSKNPPNEEEPNYEEPIGNILFNYMFNDLPSNKQKQLENWINLPLQKSYAPKEYRSNDNKYNDDTNYINFNESLIKKWNSKGLFKTKGSKYGGGAVRVEIKDDEQPLISSERFIRFEVAVDILNANNLDIQEGSQPLLINIDDTICGGFRNMYSIDKTKLFIPNTQAPNFKLNESLRYESDEVSEQIILDMDESGSITNTTNLHPIPQSNLTYTSTRLKNGQNTPHAFPSTYDLTREDNPIDEIDDSIKPFEAKKYNWGWLKNLYINYDFFLEVIQKDNYFIKDILYDLLNGMSLAANSFWKFQIIESPIIKGEFKGTTQLKVFDMNFAGITEIPTKQENGRKTFDVPIFQARGTTSPFLSIDFSTDLPKAVQNSIIQKRLSGSSRLQTHQTGGTNWDTLPLIYEFEKERVDPVIELRNKLNNRTKSNEPDFGPTENPNYSPPQEKTEKLLTGAQIRKKNLDFFREKGGVFLKQQTLPSNNENYSLELLMVGSWSDKELITQLYKNNIYKDYTEEERDRLNATYGTAEVNFKIFGMSGFKRGDILRFGGIIKKFDENCVYQVHSLKHEITTTGWFTDITCKMWPYPLKNGQTELTSTENNNLEPIT